MTDLVFLVLDPISANNQALINRDAGRHNSHNHHRHGANQRGPVEACEPGQDGAGREHRHRLRRDARIVADHDLVDPVVGVGGVGCALV